MATQDEDIRITALPTASSLTSGMYVAVDNETTGTQKYDLFELTNLEPKTATYTEADISNGAITVNGEHSLIKLTLTTISTLTINLTGNYVNFAMDVINTANNNDVTITIKSGSTTLKYAKSGGNKVTKNSYFQIAAVGSCWTLAEFM